MILDIFSGRPNPRWEVKIDNTNYFKNRLKELPNSEPLDPPGLGYRGFIIKNMSKIPDIPIRFNVYNKVISFIEEGKRIFQVDKNGLEDLLLNRATRIFQSFL